MIAAAIIVAVIVAGLFAFTHFQKFGIEKRHPMIGERIDVGGYALHAVHIPAPATADLPPVVFIHGASGNLRDPMGAFRTVLEGRAEMLFVDRPGHGYSDRGGTANARPDGQARAIRAAMRAKGIEKAIVVGHSFGAVVAANFALEFPETPLGLAFLAPATHPWPGGVAWYNHIARRPWIGRIFCHLVAMPAGLCLIRSGIACVFAPNRVPADYDATTAPALALRPACFRANAVDITNLHAHVSQVSPRYKTIKAPSVIVTGDRDGVVLPDLHARGLYRDIAGSRLVWIHGLGHKPDYLATDLCIAAIETLAGFDRNLPALARHAEDRLAREHTSSTVVEPQEAEGTRPPVHT